MLYIPENDIPRSYITIYHSVHEGKHSQGVTINEYVSSLILVKIQWPGYFYIYSLKNLQLSRWPWFKSSSINVSDDLVLCLLGDLLTVLTCCSYMPHHHTANIVRFWCLAHGQKNTEGKHDGVEAVSYSYTTVSLTTRSAPHQPCQWVWVQREIKVSHHLYKVRLQCHHLRSSELKLRIKVKKTLGL